MRTGRPRLCARHGPVLVIVKEITGRRDTNRRETPRRKPRGEAESRSTQRHDRTNRNRQRGLMWAMSVRSNAKSDSHRKTHGVEPDGTGRKHWHLTRGDLRPERAGEVSKVRSSEESRRKAAGAKGQRVTKAVPGNTDGTRRETVESQRRCNCGSHL